MFKIIKRDQNYQSDQNDQDGFWGLTYSKLINYQNSKSDQNNLKKKTVLRFHWVALPMLECKTYIECYICYDMHKKKVQLYKM